MDGNDWNRSPPPEEQANDERRECNDRIGDSLYSETFVIKTLVEMCKVIEVQANTLTQSGGSAGEPAPSTVNDVGSLDPDFEQQLCDLWDMSSNPDVAQLIVGCDGGRIFRDLLATTTNVRLKEITVGIIANVLCHPTAPVVAVPSGSETADVSKPCFEELIRDAVLSLTHDRDSATLLQVFRVLSTAVESDDWNRQWEQMFLVRGCAIDVLFIIENSKNPDLVLSAARFLDRFVDRCKDLLKVALPEVMPMIASLPDAIQATVEDCNMSACASVIGALYSLTTFEGTAPLLGIKHALKDSTAISQRVMEGKERIVFHVERPDAILQCLDQALSMYCREECYVDTEALETILLILGIVKLLIYNGDFSEAAEEIFRKVADYLSNRDEGGRQDLLKRIRSELNELSQVRTGTVK